MEVNTYYKHYERFKMCKLFTRFGLLKIRLFTYMIKSCIGLPPKIIQISLGNLVSDSKTNVFINFCNTLFTEWGKFYEIRSVCVGVRFREKNSEHTLF